MNKLQLKLGFDNGLVNDVQRYKHKTYSNLKPDAQDSALKTISGAISGISDKPVLKTYKILTTEIA